MKSYFQACRVILTPNRINRKDRTPPFCSKHQAPRSIQRDTLALPSTTQINLSGCRGIQCWTQCASHSKSRKPYQAAVHRDFNSSFTKPSTTGSTRMKKKKLRSEGHYRWGLWCPKEVESLYRWKKRMWRNKTCSLVFLLLVFLPISAKKPDFSFSVFSVCQMSSIFQVFLDRYNSPCTKLIPG